MFALQLIQRSIWCNDKPSRADRGWPVRFGYGLCLSRGRGCVCFSVSPTSELVEVFGEGRRFHLNPFFVQLLGYFLGIEAALFQPFQSRSQGENGLFHGQAAVAVQSDFDGLELGKLCLDFLQAAGVRFRLVSVCVLMLFSPVLWRGTVANMAPDFVFLLLAVERHGRPHFAK